MGILGSLTTPVHWRLLGYVLRSQISPDPVPGLSHRLFGNPGGIRSHVRNKTRSTLFAQLYSLIESLGYGHGPLRCIP